MYQLPTCRRSHPLRRPPRHLFTGLFCIEKTLMLALVYARFGYVVDACTPLLNSVCCAMLLLVVNSAGGRVFDQLHRIRISTETDRSPQSSDSACALPDWKDCSMFDMVGFSSLFVAVPYSHQLN
jgi:hypothetical protein